MVQKTPLNAGLYDQRVKLEINSATASDVDEKTGARLEIWDVEYFYAPAAYEAMPSRAGGAEYNADNVRAVEDRALFRVRYDSQTSAIDPATYRLVHNSKTWNIQRAVDPTAKRIEIHIEVNSVS